MNLKGKLENVVAVDTPMPRRSHFVEVIFGQNRGECLEWGKPVMSLFFHRQTAACNVKHYKKSRIPTDRQILPTCNSVT
jgi:hypothetical protein